MFEEEEIAVNNRHCRLRINNQLTEKTHVNAGSPPHSNTCVSEKPLSQGIICAYECVSRVLWTRNCVHRYFSIARMRANLVIQSYPAIMTYVTVAGQRMCICGRETKKPLLPRHNQPFQMNIPGPCRGNKLILHNRGIEQARRRNERGYDFILWKLSPKLGETLSKHVLYFGNKNTISI